MKMDSQLSCLWVYDEEGNVESYGISKEETKPFQALFDSVEKRCSLEAICGEYYETLGFETQQDKDNLIADAFKLFGEVKRYLSQKYKVDDYPDLSMIYNTPAGMREKLKYA